MHFGFDIKVFPAVNCEIKTNQYIHEKRMYADRVNITNSLFV